MTKLSAWKTACAMFVLCAATAIVAQAQTFNSLFSFDGANGALPWYMSPVQGRDGNLYGTTEDGGIGMGCGVFHCGTVFRITSIGTLTSLPLTPVGGSNPIAGLMLATNGNFYGTTAGGGANNAGAVIEIKGGKETVLYSFCAQTACIDGQAPLGALTEGSDGNYYGTTASGGTKFCQSQNSGCGTVFRITADGKLTTLYDFCSQANCADGYLPHAGLVQGTDGNFYGTTYEGGVSDLGTVFSITPGGKLSTLHTFEGADGGLPSGWLVEGNDGSFYGTTVEGGVTVSAGTVFKITMAGVLTTLYNFSGSDGAGPYAGLIQGTDGNFYGTTYGGGTAGGTVFEVTPGGTLTILHSFEGTDGDEPVGGLIQATSGTFYGTTSFGGNPTCDHHFGCGTVFSLSTSLVPFVAFVRAAGKVGQIAEILGQDFTGATSVSLNGTPATFTVISDTFLKATVPQGATTGYVTVVTPSGTLTSNVPFHVLP